MSYNPDTPSHPGETIADWMEENDIGFWSMVTRLGTGLYDFSGVLSGDSRITPGLAVALERVTGAPKAFWLERDRKYCVGK